MNIPRISASSFSNTAPLVWSFLYGRQHGSVELILDNAPSRSAELLAQSRVDAALVPVIAYRMIEGLRLIPDVCVGARQRVRSVCLVTRGRDLDQVRSVALDTSSKTSVALTKIIFREFINIDPAWRDSEPDIDSMLMSSDAALLIGDPALSIPDTLKPSGREGNAGESQSKLRKFDLAELWKEYTGFGFVFAMWMARTSDLDIDFASARDEGLAHLEEIAANYEPEIGIGRSQMLEYLSKNISYSIDESMQNGMELYFKLALKHGLVK